MKRKIFIIFIIILFLGAALFFIIGRKDHEKIKLSEPTQEVEKTVNNIEMQNDDNLIQNEQITEQIEENETEENITENIVIDNPEEKKTSKPENKSVNSTSNSKTSSKNASKTNEPTKSVENTEKKDNVKEEKTENPIVENKTTEKEEIVEEKKEEKKEEKQENESSYTEHEVTMAEKTECKDNQHGIGPGNTNQWFNTKAEAEAYYDKEIAVWGTKWENGEITKDEYLKKCPSGYETWTCPFCGKWTLNFYYR